MPQFRPQLFYSWSAALILGPVLAQCVVYAVLCFGFGMCLTSAVPWIMVALIISPAVFLLHWMLRGIIREEMNDVLKTIEDGGAVRSIPRAKIKAFYLFPNKVFWVSMSLMVVLLLPVSLFSLRFIGPGAFFNLLFVPIACYMMLSVIYSVEANKSMERISQFFPALTTPRKITGTLSKSLTMKTLLILAGFAVSTCCLMLISSHHDPNKGRMAGLSLLVCAVIILVCLAAVWYFGRVAGKNLKKTSKAFNALYWKREKEKKIRDVSLAFPAGIPAGDVKALLAHSKDLLRSVLEMRVMQSNALDGLMQNQKIKTLFIASMSHDLKSPLNSIIGFSELLLKGIEGELNEEQK
ncbi:MAG: histidine kinase dimerization/phospho-acceptor domain-containing protein, partial [Pseudomonadota bacterium]